MIERSTVVGRTPQSPDEDTLRVDARPDAQRPTLTALWEGGGFTLFLPDRPQLVLGRGSSADIVIDHPSISRRHVTLHLGAELSIEDLGSSNGTKVRGHALDPKQRTPLRWGEPIEVGQTLVMLNRGGPIETPRPPPPEEEENFADPPTMNDPGLELLAPAGPPPAGERMTEALRLLDLVAPTPIAVLLLGETGVGKGHLAKRVHAKSNRARGPWLHLNCAALPEQLLESELFGYERGAFTGANQAKPGLLEEASGGTVFLDEIADIPASVQAKLLLALERGEVLRIGARKPHRFDVRFVSATNKPLDPEQQSSFRSDLYYRLAGLPIVIPPLRERIDELPELCRALLEESAPRFGRTPPTLDPSTLAVIAGHSWPGNIRELASALERALLVCGPSILPQHLGLMRRSVPPAQLAPQISAPPAPEPVVPSAPPSIRPTLAEEVEGVERRRIVEALQQCGGNQVRAAELLGISRRTLITRMVTFGLRRPRKG